VVVAQYSERQLPYDHDAEASVLGALLIDGDALLKVTPIIKAADFHRRETSFASPPAWKCLAGRRPLTR
jgi:hypothetical protein